MGGRSRPGALYDPVWSLSGLETFRNGLQFNSTLSSYRLRHSQPSDLKSGIQIFKARLYPWHREAILLQNPCSSHSSVQRQWCTDWRRAVAFDYHVVVANTESKVYVLSSLLFLTYFSRFHWLLKLLPVALLILAPTKLPLQRLSPTLTPRPPLSEEIFQSGDLGALDIFALSIPLPHALPHLSRQAWNLRHPHFTSPNVQRNTRRYSLMALTEAPIPCAQYLLLKLLTKSIQNPASDRQTALPSLPSKTPAEKLNGRSLWRFRFTIIMSAELDIEQ